MSRGVLICHYMITREEYKVAKALMERETPAMFAVRPMVETIEALREVARAGNLLYYQASRGYGDLVIPEIEQALRNYKRKRYALPDWILEE